MLRFGILVPFLMTVTRDDYLFTRDCAEDRSGYSLAALGANLEEPLAQRSRVRPSQVWSKLLDQFRDTQEVREDARRKRQPLCFDLFAVESDRP